VRRIRTVAIEEKSFHGLEEVSEIVWWQRLGTHCRRRQEDGEWKRCFSFVPTPTTM